MGLMAHFCYSERRKMNFNLIILLGLIPSYLYWAGLGTQIMSATDFLKDKKLIRFDKVVYARHKWYYNFKMIFSGAFWRLALIGFVPILNLILFFSMISKKKRFNARIAMVEFLEAIEIFTYEETEQSPEAFKSELFAEMMEKIGKELSFLEEDTIEQQISEIIAEFEKTDEE